MAIQTRPSTATGFALIRRLDELSRDDIPFAGGKGANLGELTNAGFPVPSGFVVGAPAYAAFCDEGGLRTTHEMAVATSPIESPIGPIQPGTVAAQRFLWEALVDGQPVIAAAVNWLMGEEHLDPAWRFGPEGERFEVEVTGDPSCLVKFKKLHPESVAAGLARNPGIVATAMHCVNAVPYVCASEPGLRTYLEMPLVAGRAAPHLGALRGAR